VYRIGLEEVDQCLIRCIQEKKPAMVDIGNTACAKKAECNSYTSEHVQTV
jgi:hypothetical protein